MHVSTSMQSLLVWDKFSERPIVGKKMFECCVATTPYWARYFLTASSFQAMPTPRRSGMGR